MGIWSAPSPLLTAPGTHNVTLPPFAYDFQLAWSDGTALGQWSTTQTITVT